MLESFVQPSRTILHAALLSLALGLTSCSGSSQAPANQDTVTSTSTLPSVVATHGVLCDLTQQIAEATVDLTCLLQPGQDPHTYQASPSDRRAIEDADLIVYGGYGLEPNLVRLVEANGDANRVAAFEAAVPQPLFMAGHDHAHADEAGDTHAESDHAESDHAESDHAEEDAESPDPHVWHNAQNGRAIATVIAESLAEVSPEHESLYRQNAATLSDQLAQLDQWIQKQVATIPPSQRSLVTTHSAFGYYADAYGLTVKGAISGLSTAEKPTAARVTELVDAVQAAQVPAIFAEATANTQLIETVARNANVKVAEPALFVEGPGGPGTAAENYQQMLIVNTCTIVNALGGQCQTTTAPSS